MITPKKLDEIKTRASHHTRTGTRGKPSLTSFLPVGTFCNQCKRKKCGMIQTMISRIFYTIYFTLAWLLLLTGEAEAFGPITHVHLGCQILGGLSLLSPALARLLTEHASEYLYGNIAADVIIAKNLASTDKHCHNWEVGFSVLEEAHTDSQRAFAWGYLSHLAADVVAHNYFVPWKLVHGFPSRATGHAYWEIRLDQKAPNQAWDLAQSLTRQQFHEHNGLLSRTIEGTIFRFETNLTIFNGMLLVQRFKRWRGLLDRVDRRSPWVITNEEASQLHQYAVESIFNLLIHQQSSKTFQADPIGMKSLQLAKHLRNSLRHQQSKSPLHPSQLKQILEDVRTNFHKDTYNAAALPWWPPSLVRKDGGRMKAFKLR